jgi:hypothetical protein
MKKNAHIRCRGRCPLYAIDADLLESMLLTQLPFAGLRPASARVHSEKQTKTPEVHAKILQVLKSNVLFNDIGSEHASFKACTHAHADVIHE